MKGRILHESSGRMRVHLQLPRMRMEQADSLEAYLSSVSWIRQARVDERTCNVVVCYDRRHRTDLLQIFSGLDAADLTKPDFAGRAGSLRSSRALTRKYEDKMFFHIVRRAVSRFLLPAPARCVVTICKAIPYLGRAAKSLSAGRLEVSVLDAASITVSLLRGEYNTAGSVIFLLGIGDIMEEWTHRKSVEDLASAMSLQVEKVWLRHPDGQEILTGIDRIHAGDTILVRTGGVIPLDGVVLEGDGMVNQSSITGEPLPVHKRPGSLLYAGTVMEEGELAVTVRETKGEGRYDRIVRMIEESEKLKSSTEAKAARLADRLVPWTFGATALTWLLTRNAAKAASILMVDFCCALKLSMPIAVLSAMREAAGYGICVKGGKFLENFSEATTIVFDKTGTLTVAAPRVRDVIPFNGKDAQEMLRLAACLEEHYPHTIANAVVQEAKDRGLDHEEEHSTVEYIVAHGIASSIQGRKVRIGSYHFIFEDEQTVVAKEEQDRFDALPDEYSHLYLAIDGVLCAVVLIEDPLKSETASTIRDLHKLGFSRIVMMTGDSERTARAIAKAAGVDDWYAEVLPEEKAGFIRQEHENGRKVIMVGDGVNDSPALSESDCGIAINSGAAIAREIADITISEDDLHSLIILKALSDGLMDRIHGNYRQILSFNSFLLFMGAIGVFPSTTTALLHNASTIAISLHSMTNLL